MSNDKIIFERYKLYELVWSTPITKVAKSFNLPYSYFRKICIDLSVPIPDPGYWTRVRLGKQVERTPLKPLPENGKSTFELDLSLPKIFLMRNVSEMEESLNIPTKLVNPHPWIANTLYHWEHPKETVKSDYFFISVSESNRHRALLLLDTVIKILVTSGYKITLPKENNNTAAVIFDNIEIQFRLFEPQKRFVPQPMKSIIFNFEYKYIGGLALQIDCSVDIQQNFKDGKLALLESKIPSFVSNLKLAFTLKKEQDIKWRKMEQERKRLELLRQEADRKAKEEKLRVELFLSYANDWRKAKNIRGFIEQVRLKYKNEIMNQDQKVISWLTWAETIADKLDPLSLPDLFEKFDLPGK